MLPLVHLATLRQQQCHQTPLINQIPWGCAESLSLCCCPSTPVPLHCYAQPDAPSILLLIVEGSVKQCA